MAKDSLFRTSLSGFNKQDVTQYIEELNISYNRQTQELEGEINSLKKELEVLPELIQEKEQNKKLCEENEALKKEISDLNEAIKAQGEKSDENEKLLSESLDENKKLLEKLDLIQKEKDALEAECATKLSRHDEEAKELEAILSQARLEAESVIEKAKSLARQIVDKAKSKARIEADEMVRQSNEAVRDNIRKVKYLSRKKDELGDIFKNHKSQMDSFFSSISKSLNGDE